MKIFGQVILFLIMVLVLFGLQYQYWKGENGIIATDALHQQIEAQKQQNKQKILENKILKADVHDLKTGLEAVEEHARLDLGLIKPHETFVQISTAPTTHSSQLSQASDYEDAIESIP